MLKLRSTNELIVRCSLVAATFPEKMKWSCNSRMCTTVFFFFFSVKTWNILKDLQLIVGIKIYYFIKITDYETVLNVLVIRLQRENYSLCKRYNNSAIKFSSLFRNLFNIIYHNRLRFLIKYDRNCKGTFLIVSIELHVFTFSTDSWIVRVHLHKCWPVANAWLSVYHVKTLNTGFRTLLYFGCRFLTYYKI